MTANDIRIGNYHYYHIVDPLDEMGEYDDVCQIDPDDFRILTQFDCPEYKPIPLTEEWLLKFGFEEDNYNYVMGVHQQIFSGLMEFDFNERLNCWEFSIGSCNDLTRIQYVHQLQNLYFALTGEELKIKES